MVEMLQQEVIEIRADHNAKHNHLFDLSLSTSQNYATQVELSLSTSQNYVSRIDAFEKKLRISYAGSKSLSILKNMESPTFGLFQMFDTIIPYRCHRWFLQKVQSSSPLNRSVDKQSSREVPAYHDQFDSLASKVVPDTKISISRFIPPVKPALSQVKLTDLSAKSVFIWGAQMLREQQNYPYKVCNDPKITELIQAHNDLSGLYCPVKLIGLFITMDNDNLWELVLRIVRPSSYERVLMNVYFLFCILC
jgi:hypothetical protein